MRRAFLTIVALGTLGLTACEPESVAVPAVADAPSGKAPVAPVVQEWRSPEELMAHDGGAEYSDYQTAMALWRNADRRTHPKGSCAGCHGADFFDLARIGSTRGDVIRRAVADGATPDQARALANSVEALRGRYGMEAASARTFRPFQPGGAVLLPETDLPRHEARVVRDIAFGRQLESLLPTLFGSPIDTPEQAEAARTEMLDLANGTNVGGANPEALDLRALPVGLPYPLWSSDGHHGSEQATMNDWIADIAHDAAPEAEAEWHAVMDKYIDAPTRTNFWRMYETAERLTESAGMGECTYDGRNPQLACGAVADFNRNKYLSALIGQHRMREEYLGGPVEPLFDTGALALAYVDDDPRLRFMMERRDPHFLPGNVWEVGDRARVMLDNSRAEGSLRPLLAQLGYPDFVVDSVSETASERGEQEDLRRAWFWMGFTMDPSFARVHASNSTKVGEYMVASLLETNMHMHNSFAAHMRIMVKGTLPEANVERFNTRIGHVQRAPVSFDLNYSYFVGYNRTVLRWKEDKRDDTVLPDRLKAEQEAMWQRFNSNAFRAGMHLYLAEVETGRAASDVPLYALDQHFEHYQGDVREQDAALLNRLRATQY